MSAIGDIAQTVVAHPPLTDSALALGERVAGVTSLVRGSPGQSLGRLGIRVYITYLNPAPSTIVT